MISPSQPPPRGRQPARPNRRRGRRRTVLGWPPRRARRSERRQERKVPLSLRSRDVEQRQLRVIPAAAPAAGPTPRGSRGIAIRTWDVARPETPVSSQRLRRSRSALLGAVGEPCWPCLPVWRRCRPQREKGALENSSGAVPALGYLLPGKKLRAAFTCITCSSSRPQGFGSDLQNHRIS